MNDNVQEADDRYRSLLESQLAMNKVTWVRMQELGVTDSTELVLEFAYYATQEIEARALERVLNAETDYAVEVGQLEDDVVWVVQGSTQPTTLTLEKLDQWVEWMVTVGLHNGCEFDGWGAPVGETR